MMFGGISFFIGSKFRSRVCCRVKDGGCCGGGIVFFRVRDREIYIE